MNHPEGAGSQRGDWVDFDRRVWLEFRGTQFSSDGGLLVMRSGYPISRRRRCATAVRARTQFTGSTGCFGNRCMGGSPATRM